MEEKKDGAWSILDVVEDAFPGRGKETTVPIAFVLSGARWPREFRANGYPHDENGQPLYTSDSQEDFLAYVEWLADYLLLVTFEPIAEQVGLCNYASGMAQEDAMFFLGMHAGIYHAELEIGAFSDPDCIAYSETENAEKKRQWPDDSYMPSDAGYRVPLAMALRTVSERARRITLLRTFFALHTEYVNK
ncbi:MAG: hypothetical protein JXR97_11475 [Planctomycetes bacterium]|nr:hypothetical protein [Planctomycetota bacterium]